MIILKPYHLRLVLSFAFVLAFPGLAMAQEASSVNQSDTAWMLTATALVLFMTIPGLSLFYAGLVRTKNALSVLMQCFAITALITVLWFLFGYSLAFDTTGMGKNMLGVHAFIGSFNKAFLNGISENSAWGTIPETVFMVFQMTFAIITPALIIGAFAERMKFSAMLWFMGLWFTVVYLPMCHMVWGGEGAFLYDLGLIDFAGGTVVHINAGVAALVAALVLGKRKGYPSLPMPPHSLTLTVTGAGMLWVGWFGFNAGSALMANGRAGMAMVVTQIAPATAALTWLFIEWKKHGKPSVLGIVTGAIAGLASVTQASGHSGPIGAFIIGIVAGAVCYYCATSVKRYWGYDDSLDAFGVHGIGGFIGSTLTAFCALPVLGGRGYDVEGRTLAAQFGVQIIGALVTAIYSGGVSYILLKGIDSFIGLRVNEEQEATGLDVSQHEEQAYNM